MTLNKYILLPISLLLAGASYAQDIHFSQYTSAPLQLNPAFAGLNNCDYRVGVNARTQWNTVSGGNTYTTFGASGDVGIGKPTKFNSFAGLGLSIYSDVAGTLRLNTSRADLSFAYHFMLDRKATSSLSVGLQFGVNHRGINPSKGTYDEQFDPPLLGGYNPSLPTGETSINRTNMIYLDAGVGAIFSKNFRMDRHNIYLGLSAFHLNQPDISFNSTGIFAKTVVGNTQGQKLYLKTIFHGGGTFLLRDKLWLMPQFMFAFQGPSQQYNIGTLVKLQLGNRITSKTYFYLGAQYRGLFQKTNLADAVVLQTRVDIKGLSVGFSYDINVSKLNLASATFGGPELSLIFQGCMNRKPRPFFCPFM